MRDALFISVVNLKQFVARLAERYEQNVPKPDRPTGPSSSGPARPSGPLTLALTTVPRADMPHAVPVMPQTETQTAGPMFEAAPPLADPDRPHLLPSRLEVASEKEGIFRHRTGVIMRMQLARLKTGERRLRLEYAPPYEEMEVGEEMLADDLRWIASTTDEAVIRQLTALGVGARIRLIGRLSGWLRSEAAPDLRIRAEVVDIVVCRAA